MCPAQYRQVLAFYTLLGMPVTVLGTWDGGCLSSDPAIRYVSFLSKRWGHCP